MRHQDNTGKFIAFILRHHPESIGMKLDEHGWACTEDLIAGIAKMSASGSSGTSSVNTNFVFALA